MVIMEFRPRRMVILAKISISWICLRSYSCVRYRTTRRSTIRWITKRIRWAAETGCWQPCTIRALFHCLHRKKQKRKKLSWNGKKALQKTIMWKPSSITAQSVHWWSRMDLNSNIISIRPRKKKNIIRNIKKPIETRKAVCIRQVIVFTHLSIWSSRKSCRMRSMSDCRVFRMWMMREYINSRELA